MGHFFFQFGQQVGILVDQLKVGVQFFTGGGQLLIGL